MSNLNIFYRCFDHTKKVRIDIIDELITDVANAAFYSVLRRDIEKNKNNY